MPWRSSQSTCFHILSQCFNPSSSYLRDLGEPEQMRGAVDMVLAKIAEDPQSNTCPNISYSHMQGPVASAFPTGSPFAFNPSAPNNPSGFHQHHQTSPVGVGGPIGVTRSVGGERVRSAVLQNNQFAIQVREHMGIHLKHFHG